MADGEYSSNPVLTLNRDEPGVTDEVLTPVEANYLRLVKLDADRTLQTALSQIIAGRGHQSDDGRKYNFVEEQGQLMLRISA